MRTSAIAIATASAMVLVSATVFAQVQAPVSPTGLAPTPLGTAPAIRPPLPQAPKPNPLDQADVSKIMGTAVYGSDGKDIGSVSTVLMKPEQKKIDRLVVHVGGVLGVGGRYVALPLDQFSWNAQKGALTISKTVKDIDNLAEWKPPMSNSVGQAK